MAVTEKIAAKKFTRESAEKFRTASRKAKVLRRAANAKPDGPYAHAWFFKDTGIFSQFVKSAATPAHLNHVSIPLNEKRHSEFLHILNVEQHDLIFNQETKNVSSRPRGLTQTMDEMRRIRNKLLSKSDYTQLADFPGDAVAWAEYRQALRDMPQDENLTMDAIIWPDAPE